MLEFGFHSNALAAVAATTLPDSQVFSGKVGQHGRSGPRIEDVEIMQDDM